jgi:hypothetical protein
MNEDKVRAAIMVLKSQKGGFEKLNKEVTDILEEALAPPVRFYKNQPVLVRDFNGGWKKKLYHQFNNCLSHQCTMYDGTSPLNWKDVKPDTDAESIINWVEHDGSINQVATPLNSIVIIECNDGDVLYHENVSHINIDSFIARYAIIPLPEFL